MMLGRAALRLGAFCVSAIAIHVSPAFAGEGATPYLPGATIGIPKGLPPADGITISTKVLFRPNKIYDGNGHDTGARADLILNTPTIMWAPGVKLLGGTYSVYAIQPLSYRVVTSGGVQHQAAGAFNTEISPFNLAWNATKSLGISTGVLVFLNDSAFKRDGPVHIGNNYWTVEPSIGATFHKKGWMVSVFSVVDINTTNNDYVGALNTMGKHYHSGTSVYVDYTIAKKHKNLTYGVAGYWGHQLADDTVDGVAVPATATRAQGNRLEQFAVGPVLGLDVGKLNFAAYYTHDVVHQQAIAGDAFWFRISAKIK
ncbi:SphA family protein [Novosphingobium terrae]|uniref:SphA family protein n=1 Tax=Novosphingobium terrae TaxID=2726189 RepID=UPI00197D2651|nr:transporter [Novosphingobium terrae]